LLLYPVASGGGVALGVTGVRLVLLFLTQVENKKIFQMLVEEIAALATTRNTTRERTEAVGVQLVSFVEQIVLLPPSKKEY
jgi:hypothetical protein